jgi:putative membrane protein insertion efficiency factor
VTFLLKAIVHFYRRCIGPLLPPSCRFTPSCSTYALEALDRHGPWKGTRLALWRILRCNPWCKAGYDPVPAARGTVDFSRHDAKTSRRRDEEERATAEEGEKKRE